MKSILKSFSEHGTFIQPDALQYISSQKDPEEFASKLLRTLKEYPLVLTLDFIKTMEEDVQQTTDQMPVDKTVLETKEVQKRLLSQLYNPVHIINPNTILEADDEYDDPDKDDQLQPKTEISHIPETKPVDISPVHGWNPLAKQYSSEVHIIKDVTGNSTCEGTTHDFVKLFQNRHAVLKKILQSQRRELVNVLPVNRIKRSGLNEIQLIGIVKSVRNTTNGHRLIELEDETGTAALIALKNNADSFSLAQEVVPDEIIGIAGKLSKNGDLVVIENIISPDISMHHDRKKSEIPICAAFLSDIHLGSNTFLQDNWNMFLKWINGGIGNQRQQDVASTVKYLVIPGDVVDGIGIYPNQEKELLIEDIYAQYTELAKQLEYIPDHITIIMQPGNHDAVRPAEPQPTFGKEIQELFHSKEIIFVGNPCSFTIHGVEVLSYHGQSLLDFATNIQTLQYNAPIDIMKIMLKKRHLSPTYGGYTPLSPEHLDYMVIDQVPDIFVTGHVHLAAIDNYRGVTLINASSWQAQTSYQKMLNFIPDSAKIPIVNLKTGNATTMDFSKQFS